MKSDLVSKLLFYAACTSFVFIYGLAVEKYQIFPYRALYYLKDSATQVYREYRVLAGWKPVHFLQESRHDGDGVTRHEEGQASPGLTLISGFFDGNNGLRLLRLDGSPVHHWPVRFSEYFPDPQYIRPSIKIPATDWNTDIHGAAALPDGSVVFNFEYAGTVKLDRCGDVEWAIPQMTHHSIEPSADGGFWVSGRRYVESQSAFPLLDAPYHEDLILRISADGDVLQEISVPGLFYKNDLRAQLFANGIHEMRRPDELEIVHLNDIEELSGDLASQFPNFVVGDLLISLRDLNLIMVVDPRSEKVRWYKVGPWIRQHDPDFQRNGTITVFDNNSDDTRSGSIMGGSNIVEINPNNNETKIIYGGEADQLFFTNVRGKHQLLENGNILITEFTAGRVFEVNGDGEVVWEFVSRFDEDEVIEIADAIRYSVDYFTVEEWDCE